MREELFLELRSCGCKFNEDDVVFITKDRDGQIIWLEKGNSMAGLEHILKHAGDYYNAFGIEPSDIATFIENVITNGEVISSLKVFRNGREGYEKIYACNDLHCIISGIGTNGFIVSAYPARKV